MSHRILSLEERVLALSIPSYPPPPPPIIQPSHYYNVPVGNGYGYTYSGGQSNLGQGNLNVI
jgi:hypothetical protein